MMSDEPPSSSAPQISVALCVHNGERYLREQLESVLAQRGITLELVALDDASTDGSAAILRECALRDGRVRCFRNETNLGPTRSFERVMSLARGAFIAPCDQDDVWETDKLAKLLDAIGDADLAYCDSAYVDADGASLHRRISDDTHMLRGRQPLEFLFCNSVSGHAALLRQELFDAALPFPAGVIPDWWLALCAAARGGVAYLDLPLVRFRRHPQAFSRMGRDSKGNRSPYRNRAWLDQLQALMRAHAASAFAGHARASALSHAFEQARERGHVASLLLAIWRLRAFAPPADGRNVRNAIRLQFRFMRKLRRARREPQTPHFGGRSP